MTTKQKATNATDPDPKKAQAETDQQATDAALAGADAAGAGAVPAVAATPADASRDPYAGHGGLYEVRDQGLVQLEATRHPDA